MQIEIAYVISALSLVFGIYSGITNMKRSQKVDDKKDASELTTVIVKLESISNGITKIESKMNSIENDRKEDREKLIRMEESLKSAWKRIEELVQLCEKLKNKSLEKEE